MMKWQDVPRQLAVALAGALVALMLEPATAPAALRGLCALVQQGVVPVAQAADVQSDLRLFRRLQTLSQDPSFTQ